MEEQPAGNKQQGNGYPGKDGDVVERLVANNESQIKGKGLAHPPAPRQKRLYPVIAESLKQFFKLKQLTAPPQGLLEAVDWKEASLNIPC